MFWNVVLLILGVTYAQYPGQISELSPTSASQSYPYEASRPLNTEGRDQKGIPRKSESPVILVPKDSRVNIQDDRLQYTHGFSDTDSSTSVSEQGSLLSTNDGWEYVIVKKGSYSYISPEGVPVSVKYIADHNGFRVVNN